MVIKSSYKLNIETISKIINYRKTIFKKFENASAQTWELVEKAASLVIIHTPVSATVVTLSN